MPADSDAEGRLAAEPAAAELAALAARVRTADPGAVRAGAAQLRAIGEDVDASVRAVDRGAAGVGERWQGRGATAFADWVRALGAAGDRERQAVIEAGAALDRAGTAVEAVRREVEQQVTQALSQAAAARQQAAVAPAAAPDLGDRLAADALRGPTDAARAAVQRAEVELRECAARIRATADALTAFAMLAAPDAARMAPPRGTALPWQLVDDTGRTRAAAEASGAGQGGGSAGHESGTTGGGGVASGVGGGVGKAPPGQVGDWIREAMAILQTAGVPAEKMDPADIATIIERESGGDPSAVNEWDSNAAKGTPSQGLMQTIGPTFEAYKLPGHDDIRNPVDNIIAGVRYAIERYGSVSRVPGVAAEARGDAYVGY